MSIEPGDPMLIEHVDLPNQRVVVRSGYILDTLPIVWMGDEDGEDTDDPRECAVVVFGYEEMKGSRTGSFYTLKLESPGPAPVLH